MKKKTVKTTAKLPRPGDFIEFRLWTGDVRTAKVIKTLKYEQLLTIEFTQDPGTRYDIDFTNILSVNGHAFDIINALNIEEISD